MQLTWELAGRASGLQEGEGGSQRQEAFTLGPQLQHKTTSFPAQSEGGRTVLALGLAAAALLLMCEDQLVKSEFDCWDPGRSRMMFSLA